MRFKRVKSKNLFDNFCLKNRKGQLAIFIILAILLVAMVAVVFVFRNSIFPNRISSEMEPVYNTFINCLENDLVLGINVLESQGGYIYLPEYEAGSEYMPFSSQLDFLGNPIPYWYYVSGNNIQKEQVPSEKDMEKDLERFIGDKARECSFESYYSQGYEITMGEPKADINVNDGKVVLNLEMYFLVSREDETYLARDHEVSVDSELGSLYKSALNVYEKEQQELFLEEYAIDVLRLYAPVDGVEMSCSPLVWDASKVFRELREAIQLNTLMLKEGNTKGEYFEVDINGIPSNQRVRFLNSQNWTSTFEVNPSDEQIMLANPVGNQEGMGILGFCYVPYHFVYSMRYPVLVQIISGNAAEEIFQFPMAVVIERNTPRTVSGGEAVEISYDELCEEKNVKTNVRVYDSNLKPVDAYVSYSCLGTTCNLGATEEGAFIGEFPQCVNGFINVRADGYKEESIMYSTMAEGALSIYLSKLYDMNVQLKVENQNYNREAVIYFTSDDSSQILYYPQQKTVKLGEGDYEIQVYVYRNSSLNLGATTQEKCIEVPRSSIGGVLGLTKTECYEVEVPAQIISNALSAGGKFNYTFLEGDLRRFKAVDLNVDSFPAPNSLEQIQKNYILFESSGLEVNLR